MDDQGTVLPPPPPPESGGQQLPQRDVGDILESAFSVYRNNAAQLLLIVAVIVVPLSVINFLFSHYVFAPASKGETRSVGIAILAALVAAAIGVIITAVLQAAILRAAAQATIGDPVDVEASYRWGLRKFGSILLVSILVGLIVAVGFILLIIPGIIFLVFLAVSVPAVVVEDRRGTDALKRSWNLVSGHFWHVLGAVVVAAVIAGVVSSVLTAIAGSNAVLQLILGTIAQIIVAPFSALVTILLYLDLRARKEFTTVTALRTELATTT